MRRVCSGEGTPNLRCSVLRPPLRVMPFISQFVKCRQTVVTPPNDVANKRARISHVATLAREKRPAFYPVIYSLRSCLPKHAHAPNINPHKHLALLLKAFVTKSPSSLDASINDVHTIFAFFDPLFLLV